MEIDRGNLEIRVVAFMNDGHENGIVTNNELKELKEYAKGVYNPETLEGDPEEALTKSIKAARGFAQLAKSSDRMRCEERESFVYQSRGMYAFAMAVARSVGLKVGELIYKEFEDERVEMGRTLKASKKERVNQQKLHKRIERRAYGR